jgi:hypothetical protein
MVVVELKHTRPDFLQRMGPFLDQNWLLYGARSSNNALFTRTLFSEAYASSPEGISSYNITTRRSFVIRRYALGLKRNVLQL